MQYLVIRDRINYHQFAFIKPSYEKKSSKEYCDTFDAN